MNLHTESGLFYQLWVWLSGILAGQHCFVILHDSDYALLPLKSKTNYDGMAAGLPPPPVSYLVVLSWEIIQPVEVIN